MNLINNIKNLKQYISILSEGYFYVFIVARKKWCSDLKSGEIVIRRKFVKKNDIIPYLESLEKDLPFRDNKGDLIPINSIGVYINTNKRDFKKGLVSVGYQYMLNLSNFKSDNDKKFMSKYMNDMIFGFEYLIENPIEYFNKFNESNSISHRFKSIMKTELSKSKGERRFIDIDFDVKVKGSQLDRTHLNPIIQFVKEKTGATIHVIHTRGGMHIQVESSTIKKECQSTWYKSIESLKTFKLNPDCPNDLKIALDYVEVDFCGNGDKICPLVGCFQGGFVPHHIQI